MLFPKRQDYKVHITNAALGTTHLIELTREFFIESIIVRLSFTPTAVMATDSPDSIQNLLKRVQLTVADGARIRTVVDVSGPALLEYCKQTQGTLDRQTLQAIGVDDTAAKVINYPIFLAHPQLEDPVGSTLLLPAPRFSSNPVLRIELSSQAEMDSNGTPTFAISAGVNISIVVNRRQVGILDWPTFDTEFIEATEPFANNSASQLALELGTPGSYTGILMRGYTSATARGDVSQANGEFRLDVLGTVLRRFRLSDLAVENELSSTPNVGTGVTVFTASHYLDFLTDKTGAVAGDMGSVLDCNPLVTSGARAKLIGDIAGGAGVQIKFVTHRVFGNLSSLKLGK